MTDYAAAREIMVDRQVRTADVTLYPIIAAMLEVPREPFVPEALRPVAYLGEHVPLAPGRVLLDPRVFAKLLDALNVGPDDLVLDVERSVGGDAIGERSGVDDRGVDALGGEQRLGLGRHGGVGFDGDDRLGLRTATGIAWRRIFDATAPVLPGFAAAKAFEF